MNTSVDSADEYIIAQEEEVRRGSPLEQLDLQHYLRILRKHKWPIVLFTAICTGLAAYYAYTATPIYSATSTLLIEQQKANIVNFEELYDVDSGNTDYYQTQYELLQSRSLAQKVIDTLGLWDHPELSPETAAAAAATEEGASSDGGGLMDRVTGFFEQDAASIEASIESADEPVRLASESAADTASATDPFAPPTTVPGGLDADREPLDSEREAAISRFLSRLTISPVRKTKLVKISYESADPQLAVRVANAVGEGYITSYLESKLELTERASSWLGERLASLKETLDESEQRLVAFKEANGLVDVDGSVGRLNEQELLLSTAELAQARSDLSDAADLYREVQALRDRPELLTSIAAIQADPIVQRVKIEQGQAQRNLDELRNRYGDRHPRVVDAQSALNTLDVTLNQTLERVVGSIEKNYQFLQQRVGSIENQLAQGKQDIQAIGNKKFELDSLEREVETNRSIYDEFFSRMSQAKSADGLETANARVSDYAITPTTPIKPKKQLIIALAALASLVLSSLMALLYEQMDETVKSTTDVERKLKMPLLGILPLVKSGLFGRKSDLPLNPVEIQDEKNTFHEAVNTARTAITVGQKDGEGKVIMVTSSVPGEGKSTASINLAYSLSRMERVLLIDCDMRRPTIAKSIGRDRAAHGLSSLIMRTAPASECIVRGAYDGTVDVLPAGPISEHPLELLSSPRFKSIIESLKKHYDRIVIDCAPTQAVSDAFVIARVCDVVVYVVKSHDTSINIVRSGIQRLEQSGAEITGVLMTQVDVDKLASYGGDYYYQGYYDYYGYTESGDRKDSSPKIRLTPEELLELRNDRSDVNLNLGQAGGRAERPGTAPPDAETKLRRSSNRRFAEDDLDIV